MHAPVRETMTVKELIASLSNMPLDQLVVVEGGFEDRYIIDIEQQSDNTVRLLLDDRYIVISKKEKQNHET